MSWDVILLKFDGEPPKASEIPEDFQQPILGDSEQIRESISELFPEVDWSNPTWGFLRTDQWSIEFNHSQDGNTDSLMLHIRGGGDPVSAIKRICDEFEWTALDCSTGEFIDFSSEVFESWKVYQGFREKLIGMHGMETPKDSVATNWIISAALFILFFFIYIRTQK